ncbi:calcium channel flower isoform X1 [Schistocerca gregaria]|uniref:calcium channel flower isoform X1 n=1 Tax=Schistocerca gregaria TaxID=7010 RepID=UPI00211E124F|nr:calcium channel flower isoform X1 [Schistocerca gregaria]
MSFAEKIGALMQRPGQDPVAKDDIPWWMKYAGRGLGTVGSLVAIGLGVWNCVGIVIGQVDCLIGGMWQMLAGFLVIVVEAPCCCMFLDFVQNISDWVEKRPYWNRGAFYCIIALPAIFLCPGLGSIFGSGLIFTTGVIYGLMALGRKATAEEMRSNAAQPDGLPTGTHSNLVDHAQPTAVSDPPKSSLVGIV